MIQNDFLSGQDCYAFEYFGAHLVENGVMIRTYAPNAQRVQLVYNGNYYDMGNLGNGIWEYFMPDGKEWDIYQFLITSKSFDNRYRADPFAFYSEVRPKNGSIVYNVDKHNWSDYEWMKNRTKNYDKPVNIYEVHFGSWKIKWDNEEDNRFYSYDEMINQLIPYVKEMGFTHIELLPLTEYPFDGSWGYQVSGYFSATSRYGEPEGLMRFIEACHNASIGVILDFVPVHFVRDMFALHLYDGSFVFEKDNEADRYSEWDTALFDYSKPHVLSFMKSAINFWIEKYHIDGVRYDAVAYLIYKYGNKNSPINDSGIWFLKNTNYAIQKKHPDVMLFAEDSTDYLKVTAPVEFGGLGFDYKWDLGFMNDTINYIKTPPGERSREHNKMTFSMSYFYNDLFILPYSHDEVVHCKGTMLDKCFGTHKEKIATAKVLYTFQFCHPGKKLNFMGNELGEYMEWRDNKELGWNLLEYPDHDSLHRYFKDLNHLYLNEPALYEMDYNASYFKWCDANNREANIFSFLRKDCKGNILYSIFNYSNRKQDYSLTVESNCDYVEILNSDRDIYGGTNVLNNNLHSDNFRLNLKLAPFSCCIIKKS